MSVAAVPIETHYKGCRFRSRLEARWAVYFDALGIEWEYEPQGYKLPSGECYLPDFWLPQVRMFAEVKAGEFTAEEEEKAAALPFECLMLDGPPAAHAYSFATSAKEKDRDPGGPWRGRDCSVTCCYLNEGRFFQWGGAGYRATEEERRAACAGCSRDERAIAVARSARFEFGESG